MTSARITYGDQKADTSVSSRNINLSLCLTNVLQCVNFAKTIKFGHRCSLPGALENDILSKYILMSLFVPAINKIKYNVNCYSDYFN